MNIQLKDIPSIQAAIDAAREKERDFRDTAFLPVTLDICGVAVEHFKPRHYLLLCAVKSPIFFPGPIEAEHVAQFIWVVSPEFSYEKRVRDDYVSGIGDFMPPSEIVIPEIFGYLEQAFMDTLPTTEQAREYEPIASVFAHLCHDLASAYGWTCEKTMDTPFSQLYQFLRLISRDHAAKGGKKNPVINKFSSRARNLAFAEWQRAQKEARAQAGTPDVAEVPTPSSSYAPLITGTPPAK